MRDKWKLIYAFIGSGMGFISGLVLYITFLYAYFNGFQTTVFINMFGEAHLEFFVIPIVLVLSLYSFIYFYNRIKLEVEKI